MTPTHTIEFDDPLEIAKDVGSLSGLEFLQRLVQRKTRVPIGASLGFTLAEVREGHAVFEAEAAPNVFNPIGSVQGGWYAAVGRDSGGGGASNLPTEQIVEATVGTIAKTVTAQGVVAAADSDDLSFASSGTVTAVNVKAGQKVAAGDVLATLDSPALRQAVADAQARLASAKATLADDTASGASAPACTLWTTPPSRATSTPWCTTPATAWPT